MSLEKKSGVMPRDAININEILRSQGVVDYNPQILSQLLEFSYRYTADLLTDADDYRENMGKPLISRKDIELAIQVKAKLFNDTQPTQQNLEAQAKIINNTPLQDIPGKGGILLPPSNRLMTDNYDVISKKRATENIPRIN